MSTILFLIGCFFIGTFMMFLKDRKKWNQDAYDSLPPNWKELIERKDAQKLAETLVKLELDGMHNTGDKLIKGIESKGIVLITKVDKIRNKLRIEAGLGPLKLL